MRKRLPELLAFLALLAPCSALAGDLDYSMGKIVEKFVDATAAQTTGTPVVAVLNFDAESKLRDRKVDVAVADILTHYLLERGKLRIVERNQIEALFKEQKLGETGAVDPATAAKMGKVLGARYLVVGSIARLGSSYQISAKLVDSESAQVVTAEYGEVPVKVFDTEAANYIQLVPEEQAIGLYAGLDTAAPTSTKNGAATPRALDGGNMLTLSDPTSTPMNFEIGLRYMVIRWLMFDIAYSPNAVSTQVSFVDQAGGPPFTGQPNVLVGHSVTASLNWVGHLASALRCYAGAGAQLYFVSLGGGGNSTTALDPTDAIHFANAGGGGGNSSYDTNVTFTRPFGRLGVEWRPLTRLGISVFGNVYPVSKDVDVFLNNTNGTLNTSTPVLSYTMPTVTGTASIAFYF
jgi:TolB-like protein